MNEDNNSESNSGHLENLELRITRLRSGIKAALGALKNLGSTGDHISAILQDAITQDESDMFFSTPTTNITAAAEYSRRCAERLGAEADIAGLFKDDAYDIFDDSVMNFELSKKLPAVFTPFSHVNVTDDEANANREHQYSLFMEQIERHVASDSRLQKNIAEYYYKEIALEEETIKSTGEKNLAANAASKKKESYNSKGDSQQQKEETPSQGSITRNIHNKESTGNVDDYTDNDLSECRDALELASAARSIADGDDEVKNQMKDMDRLIDEQLRSGAF